MIEEPITPDLGETAQTELRGARNNRTQVETNWIQMRHEVHQMRKLNICHFQVGSKPFQKIASHGNCG